jgi:hypothetical protein
VIEEKVEKRAVDETKSKSKKKDLDDLLDIEGGLI